jgi:hypothetical protein
MKAPQLLFLVTAALSLSPFFANADTVTSNLIQNSYFSDLSDPDNPVGSLEYWDITHLSPYVIPSSTGSDRYVVRGGGNSDNYSRIEQTIDLSVFNEDMIDSGDVTWDFSALLYSYAGRDISAAYVSFYDDLGNELQSVTTGGITSTDSDIVYTLSDYVPSGSDSIVVAWDATRKYGSGNNGYMSAPELTMTVSFELANAYDGAAFRVPAPMWGIFLAPLLMARRNKKQKA